MKMECNQCGVEKELNKDNYYETNTKFGWDKTCKICRLINQNNRRNKIKNKGKSKSEVKYRKTKDLVEPKIPIKLTFQDGFGGYYFYDANRLSEPLINSFIREHGILHRNKHYLILQVKSQNKQQMLDFAQCIDMSVNGVIHIQREPGKEHLEAYVVNLMGKNIRQVLSVQ